MTTELKTPTLDDVMDAFEHLYPANLQEDWDASGLVVGRLSAPVRTVSFAVDAIQATVHEAIVLSSDLLITHHPLLLRGAKFLPDTDYKGNIIHTLIENKCALLGAHTNADSAVDGVNSALMLALGITESTSLDGDKTQTIDGATHSVGIGRVGELSEPITLKELAEKLASVLPATAGGLRVAGNPADRVQTIAVCGGSGDSLFSLVKKANADVFITADLRHHPASELREQALIEGGKPYLIDCSHFASEWVWLNTGAQKLKEELAARGFAIETQVLTTNSDPWDFRVSTGECAGSASTAS
ncbi:Nif3-like dinuclear metal center hexameric protein [Rothia terrae]|uniref:Nif3-like dinuclear metal center hexameric protein n=1 Tax=Rothia terrae TaxID=396015 RepID=UPI00144525A8|nr:Nif3-like dinuclear metal center hexameric protein [Rothia terrae]NKZ34839.1 Nif3-like dinuclear metal center hexameric protein [Rothia terrae]